jgi:hypothetical protein
MLQKVEKTSNYKISKVTTGRVTKSRKLQNVEKGQKLQNAEKGRKLRCSI